MNGKRRNNYRNNRSKRRPRDKANQNALLSIPSAKVINMSMLGRTAPRKLDAIIPVLAVNNFGSGFYSFLTSSSAPSLSVNLSDRIVADFAEYANLAKMYGLIQLKSIELRIVRASNTVNNSNVMIETPSLFLQVSQTNYPAGSIALQQAIATSDNAVEINLQSFDAFRAICQIPPVLVQKSSVLADNFTIGSSVWNPTAIGSTQTLPAIYLNLGSLQQPTFASSTTIAYKLLTIHVIYNVVFAGTQSN